MSNPIVDSEGNKIWLNSQGQHHRLDGPASEWTNGSKFWYQNNLFHREDGPAVEWADGTKYWYYEGKEIK